MFVVGEPVDFRHNLYTLAFGLHIFRAIYTFCHRVSIEFDESLITLSQTNSLVTSQSAMLPVHHLGPVKRTPGIRCHFNGRCMLCP